MPVDCKIPASASSKVVSCSYISQSPELISFQQQQKSKHHQTFPTSVQFLKYVSERCVFLYGTCFPTYEARNFLVKQEAFRNLKRKILKCTVKIKTFPQTVVQNLSVCIVHNSAGLKWHPGAQEGGEAPMVVWKGQSGSAFISEKIHYFLLMQCINNIQVGKSSNGHHWDYSLTVLDVKTVPNLSLRRSVGAAPTKAEVSWQGQWLVTLNGTQCTSLLEGWKRASLVTK